MLSRYDRGYNDSYNGDTRGKYDRGYQSKSFGGDGYRGGSRSPSPSGQKAMSGNQARDQSWNRGRSRSRSRSPDRGQPGRSFHQMMMERTRSSPKNQQKFSAAEYDNGHSKWGKSKQNEEEEGAIPADC